MVEAFFVVNARAVLSPTTTTPATPTQQPPPQQQQQQQAAAGVEEGKRGEGKEEEEEGGGEPEGKESPEERDLARVKLFVEAHRCVGRGGGCMCEGLGGGVDWRVFLLFPRADVFIHSNVWLIPLSLHQIQIHTHTHTYTRNTPHQTQNELTPPLPTTPPPTPIPIGNCSMPSCGSSPPSSTRPSRPSSSSPRAAAAWTLTTRRPTSGHR